MARTVRQVMTDAKTVQAELAGHLRMLEATNEGNSHLAWRIRDYISAVDRLAQELPVSDRTI